MKQKTVLSLVFYSYLCICLCLFLTFFVVPVLVSNANYRKQQSIGKITRGSSLSTSPSSNDDTSPYWLSPSGNIAFGFYQLPSSPNLYVVGIWFIKSSRRTLVWTANYNNDLPLDKPCSILFTEEGNLVLRVLPDNQDKLLLHDLAEPVSYARMHDNGNFVLYDSESQIVWESFDYPTHTLLGGQKLKLGVDRLLSQSGRYKLSIKKTDDVVVRLGISKVLTSEFKTAISTVHWFRPKPQMPATLNLDTTGMLYLIDSSGARHEISYEDKNQQLKLEDEKDVTSYIYRATLDSQGDFELYKERIDGNYNEESSSSSLVLVWASYQCSKFETYVAIVSIFVVGVPMLAIICCVGFEDNK